MTAKPVDKEYVATHYLSLPMVEVRRSLMAGLQVEWASATLPDGREVSVTVGAGCGSQYGNAIVGDRQYVFDVKDIVEWLRMQGEPG